MPIEGVFQLPTGSRQFTMLIFLGYDKRHGQWPKQMLCRRLLEDGAKATRCQLNGQRCLRGCWGFRCVGVSVFI